MQTRKELILKLEKAEADKCLLWGVLLIALLLVFILVAQLTVMNDNLLIVIGAFLSPVIWLLPFELKRREEIRRYFWDFRKNPIYNFFSSR